MMRTRAGAGPHGFATLESGLSVSLPKDMEGLGGGVGEELFARKKLRITGGNTGFPWEDRSAAARYPELTVCMLDAHADLRSEYQGRSYSNAS